MRLAAKNADNFIATFHRLWVFEDRVLRRIFGLMREEVAGGWRKLHNEELHNFYVTRSIVRVLK